MLYRDVEKIMLACAKKAANRTVLSSDKVTRDIADDDDDALSALLACVQDGLLGKFDVGVDLTGAADAEKAKNRNGTYRKLGLWAFHKATD